MKVITLNMWRYYKWETRKEALIRFLKEQNADIIFLQEVSYDERVTEWENQAHEVATAISYSYHAYGKLMDMKKWHQKPIDWHMEFGVAIISKYPIVSSKIIHCTPVEKKNKTLGFMHAQLNTPQCPIDCVSVHFENTDAGSNAHLKETLSWCEQRLIQPIIAGDFNMPDTNEALTQANNYHVSYELTPYTSFNPTAHSHNDKPITLDYIIAHKQKFTMRDITCVENDISDHNPVIAHVTLN